MKKILILVIYSKDEKIKEYDMMKEIWLKYMNRNNNIKSYFITYKEELEEEYMIEGNYIYIKGKESLIPGVYDKTIKSMKIVKYIYDYEYCVRTNISTFINMYKLEEYINKIEMEERVYCGSRGEVDIEKNKIFFMSGTSIILSRDLCDYLIENHNEYVKINLIDDVLIGYIFKENKNINIIDINKESSNRVDLINSKIDYKQKIENFNGFIYRIKCIDNRYKDVIIMNFLYNKIYNK
jgi:hypothetical protein